MKVIELINLLMNEEPTAQVVLCMPDGRQLLTFDEISVTELDHVGDEDVIVVISSEPV